MRESARLARLRPSASVRRWPAALVAAAVVVLVAPAGVRAADDTFTMVSGTPNPAAPGQRVTVLAMECDRSANVNPTGTITLTDRASGAALGGGELGSNPQDGVNCSETSIVLPPLSPGPHTIAAIYEPSGPIAVTSSSAVYTQLAGGPDDTVTEVSGRPNPAPNGEDVIVLARECDRSADVHPTGTIVLTDEATGKPLGTALLGAGASSVAANCSESSVVLSPLNAGQHTIRAHYVPSGEIAVTASTGSYTQVVSGSDDTFTQVSGTPNPAPAGHLVTVTAWQCDRSANVNPTGAIILTDQESPGEPLGRGDLGSVSPPGVNCSATSIPIVPGTGQRTIVARYEPSGPVAVTASSGSYAQSIVAPPSPAPVSTQPPGSMPGAAGPPAPVGVLPVVGRVQRPRAGVEAAGRPPIASAVPVAAATAAPVAAVPARQAPVVSGEPGMTGIADQPGVAAPGSYAAVSGGHPAVQGAIASPSLRPEVGLALVPLALLGLLLLVAWLRIRHDASFAPAAVQT